MYDLFDSANMVLAEDPPLFRDLMRFKPDSLTPNAWAVKAGVSRTVWADMRRHGNPSRRTLEKLLTAVGSSLAEFEALRIGDAPVSVIPEGNAGLGDARSAGWRPAPLSPVPLLATAMAGEWGESGSGIELTELRPDETHGQVTRPASLAHDRQAYAVTILGDAMWPRFRLGRQLLVSPAAPVTTGDDVLVQLAPNDPDSRTAKVLIKELVRRTASFAELRQFNPDVTFRVEAAWIASIHKVVGEVI